jgi:hypothetical protein
MDEGKRWLKAEDAATYVRVRVDQMRRLIGPEAPGTVA